MLPPSASCVVLFAFFKQKIRLWKMVNAAVSCQTLRRLPSAVLISGVVLIHENARPHSAVVIQQLLEQIKWDVSRHSTYSPDLATSDFHIFPELKNWLGGQSFQKNEEIQSKVKANLTSMAVTFYEEGIGDLVYRYNKCLNLHGDYVEPCLNITFGNKLILSSTLSFLWSIGG
ncbi:Histone-lysine N-methyltransferase SETMAR [Araneus ventricosus]|uniref:Histone-lysine N-methyltransferase SETMAR n=1 Tax=Araneus ventricosus TaxID=182803 RepID=A0A4Y2IRD1_ARAVE|nr:Histone-lysine N-methyltransferase SETMAR [Araneus ventricosus]